MSKEAKEDFLKEPIYPITEPPSYDQSSGKILSWDFICLEQAITDNFTLYTSLDAQEKYKLFKNAKGSEDYIRARDLQQNGFALPVLQANRTLFKLNKFLTIYKFRPPPAAGTRLFSKKEDRYVFCKVERRWSIGYTRYILEFTPDFDNPNRKFTVTMIEHSRKPIIDISEFNGKRLRWTYSRYFFSGTHWAYNLNVLPPDTPSLTDNLTSENKVNSKNPLLGSSWGNVLIPRSRRGYVYESNHCVGKLYDALQIIGFKSTKFTFQKHTMDTNLSPESIFSVDEETMVILCIAAVIKRIEEIKADARKSR